jgi:hypothetical protein
MDQNSHSSSMLGEKTLFDPFRVPTRPLGGVAISAR